MKGEIPCEDGICRTNCPAFNGCPLTAPLQCPGGKCATNWYECAGYDQCPLNKPYRTSNLSCTSYPFNSTVYLRDLKFNMIDYTVDPNKNSQLVINDLTGVYSNLIFQLQHSILNNKLDTGV